MAELTFSDEGQTLMGESPEQVVDEFAAYDVAALARQGTLPTELAVEGDDGSIVQVVDRDGRVVAATAGLRRDQSLARFRPPGAASFKPGSTRQDFKISRDFGFK